MSREGEQWLADQLDAARAEVAALKAENELLRAVADAARSDPHPLTSTSYALAVYDYSRKADR